MKIMIVEDHHWMRKNICALLARPDVELLECATGEEAIASVHDFKPDWLITDVNLPGANGFEIAEVIRSHAPSARIIIMSAEDRAYLSEQARRVGAERFICKHSLAGLPDVLYGDAA